MVKPLSADDASEREVLERRRRDIDRELAIVKEQLQQAMQVQPRAYERRTPHAIPPTPDTLRLPSSQHPHTLHGSLS